uniref:Uncharacterized protein n=1 Tax=Anguilla anguilla TaxID=7936 RepID=A0A0E9TXU8_ANGAN
MRFYFSGNQ